MNGQDQDRSCLSNNGGIHRALHTFMHHEHKEDIQRQVQNAAGAHPQRRQAGIVIAEHEEIQQKVQKKQGRCRDQRLHIAAAEIPEQRYVRSGAEPGQQRPGQQVAQHGDGHAGQQQFRAQPAAVGKRPFPVLRRGQPGMRNAAAAGIADPQQIENEINRRRQPDGRKARFPDPVSHDQRVRDIGQRQGQAGDQGRRKHPEKHFPGHCLKHFARSRSVLPAHRSTS